MPMNLDNCAHNIGENLSPDRTDASDFGSSVAQAIAATLTIVTGFKWAATKRDGEWHVTTVNDGVTIYWCG